jgi:hypothetical protein
VLPNFSIAVETTNTAGSIGESGLLNSFVSHTYQPWDTFMIGTGTSAGSLNGSGSIITPNIASGATAAPIYTTTGMPWVASPKIEPLPEKASVRFLTDGEPYTGEIVSSNTEIHSEPVYVIQPDNPVPKTGMKPLALLHSQVERISFLQRFTEAVWAEG